MESDQPAGVVSLLVGYSRSCGFLHTYGAEIPMMLTGQEPPSQADGSGFFTLATFNVCSSRNGSLEVCRVFYKATVMSVLLFGSETWSLAPGTLKRYDGFHHRAAWPMAGMCPSHNGKGNWTYLSNNRTLKKVGLYRIEHYIGVR